MDATRLLVNVILMSFCSLSKQDENLGKNRSAGKEDEGACELGWTDFVFNKHHCYKFNSDELNWENAEKSCNDDGASLVYIEDAAENEWLAGLCPDSCWIGIRRRKQDDNWVWSHNNATANFTDWNQGQPDNNRTNEDCGGFFSSTSWNDEPCTLFRKYICKKKKRMISRKCRKDGYNGTWLDPSFTNCTREKIAEIQNKLNRIKDGVAVDKLVNVIREFRNTIEEIVQTYISASDIRACVQVLATVSEIVTSREENITVEETEEFFYATDVLLSGEYKESWQDLYTEVRNKSKTKDNGAARVMDIVGDISNRAMENLVVDKPISVQRKNIVLLIEKTNIGSITFPKNKTFEITSEVELSEETIKNSLKVNSSVRYSATYYKTLGNFLPNSFGKEKIGSAIMAFTLPESDILRQLNPPIRVTFKTKEVDLFYLTMGFWAGDGCWVSAVNESFTECECNHLTNFAVLISLTGISKDHHEAMSMISLVGFITSTVFLIVTVAVYIHHWRHLESDKAVVLIIMCIILILAYLTFLIGIEQTENKNVCTAVAVTLHYLFLVFVCLMASEGIIHAVMVVCVFRQGQSINRILIPKSFGVPLVIVAVSGAITQLDGYGTDKFCWLATGNGLIYSFLGPCYAVVVINLVITGVLLKKLFSTKGAMNKTKREKIWTGIRSLLILAPVFGLTWLFGFFSFHDDAVAFAYLFVIFNSLQGLLICIMHTFMNQIVKIQMTRTIGRLRQKKEAVTTSDSSTWKKIFKEIRDKASIDTNLTTNTKSTTDGAGLESSISGSTYELKANSKNRVMKESCFKDTNDKQNTKKSKI